MPLESGGSGGGGGGAPDPHALSHAIGGSDQVASLPTAAQKLALVGTSGSPNSGNEFVTASDARLTNARTPSVHASTHAIGGSDAVPTLPSTDEKAALVGTSGSPSGANAFVTNSDARNSDARAPTAHQSSHVSGGDAIPVASGGSPGLMSTAGFTKLAGIEALADVTDFANVSAALAAASADVAFNARKLTGVADPSNAQDAATKNYVDSMSGGSVVTLLNTGGVPFNYALNTPWSITSKTTIATFTFTTTASGKVQLTVKGNFSGTNGAWADLISEIVAVAGTEKAATIHFHTNGPRDEFTIHRTITGLTANTLYTCTISITPGSGTITCNASSSPITNWLQGEAREGA